jgi:hypothetical protein
MAGWLEKSEEMTEYNKKMLSVKVWLLEKYILHVKHIMTQESLVFEFHLANKVRRLRYAAFIQKQMHASF